MITAHGPISRHITEYLTDQRVKHYKCKTLQNPDYFFDGKVYGSVDVAHKLDTSTEKAGGLWLRNKAIVSVGTKKADDAYKLFGLRPDENQSGSESVEWSIESIEINGVSQTINLRDRLEVSPITTKFGDNLYVQRARQRCRVMVPGDSTTESFKIVLRLHLKGCTVTYRQDLDEYWIYRGDTFFCRLGKPYLVDMDMNPIQGDFVQHSLVEIGKGEYRYTKEPTAAFALADLPANYLIDADTVYSSTADGCVWRNVSGENVWATTRNATDGTDVDKTSYTLGTVAGADFYFGKYNIYRGFGYYVTSGVTGTITAVDDKLYMNTSDHNRDSDVCALQGTQADSLTTADYDAFSGDSFGYDTWAGASTGLRTISYDAAGISAINQAGTTKICHREYSHDYSNSAPGAGTQCNNGHYLVERAGTTYDPYLYITTAVAGGNAVPSYYKAMLKRRYSS